ncbi:winged helix-turn-helix domain-containing protein [Mesorhizobium sp. M0152]|uniref:winged helix-turn-helix domain-containing tetratricopeptide repeat protein n=1 Tax=Mesorhizobium sp. M0152 TaxID=2956898 RepID=UPI003334D6DA
MSQTQQPIYRFAGFSLDTAAGLLRDGSGEIALRPKSFALLIYFIENVGRVLSKDELIAAVWPDVTVSDDSLTQCITDIRRSLGPRGEGLIRTVARRGYAVDEDRVETVAKPSNPTSGQETNLSIAVLPFQILADDGSGFRFGAGLLENIVADLTRFRDLDVLQQARGSDASQEAEEAASTRRADYVLNGKLQYSEGIVRVTVTLVETATFKSVWANRWDCRLTDIFTIQSEIAEGVVNSLAGFGVILHAAAERAARKAPSDLTAYELYLIGRAHNNRFNIEDSKQALHCFQSAVTIDPQLARAWVGLAWSYDQLTAFGVDVTGNTQSMLRAARRAVELDPMDAEAHSALGEALGYTGELGAAEEALDRSMLLAPGSADICAMFSGWAPRFGRAVEGAQAADRAQRLNPHGPVWYSFYFRTAYFLSGRFEEALRTVTRKQPQSRTLTDFVYAAASAVALGRDSQALGQAKEHAFPGIAAFLDYAGIAIPDQRNLFATLMKQAGFDD